MTTDGPPVSPIGDHMTRKYDKRDQTVERRSGQILAVHDIARESTRQTNFETVIHSQAVQVRDQQSSYYTTKLAIFY